jgi:hypothetical protein
MNTKLTPADIKWMNEKLKRADLSNDVKIIPSKHPDGKYIRTPDELCGEIVSQITVHLPLKDKKILVVDTVEFIPVLLAFGAEKCNITYIAPYEYKGPLIAAIIGVRVVQQSLLEWEPDMKFDVVVGNPPYQDENKNPLYYKFHNKVLKDIIKGNGILAFVTPDQMTVALTTGIIKGCHTVIQRKILLMNISASLRDTHFKGVGSTICYYILKNTEYNASEQYESITDSGKALIVPSPFKMSLSDNISISIISKCFEFGKNPYNGCWSTAGKKAIKDDTSSDSVVLNIDKNGKFTTYQVRWVDKHKLSGIPKIFITGFGNRASVAYDHTLVCAIEKFVYTVPTASDKESENLVNLLSCKLQKFFTKAIKARGPFIDFLIHFKGVDISKCWTDTDLYAYFNITQDEIDYIEATIK